MTTDYKAWTVYLLALAAIVAGALFIWTPAQAQEPKACVTLERYSDQVQTAANVRGHPIAMAKSVPNAGNQKLAILFPDDSAVVVIFEDGCMKGILPMAGPVVRKHVFADRTLKQIFGVGA